MGQFFLWRFRPGCRHGKCRCSARQHHDGNANKDLPAYTGSTAEYAFLAQQPAIPVDYSAITQLWVKGAVGGEELSLMATGDSSTFVSKTITLTTS